MLNSARFNEAPRAELVITNLISNKPEWSNCLIKFGTAVYLEIIAKFYWFLINITKRQKVDVAKTTASGKLHGMRAVCKLS